MMNEYEYVKEVAAKIDAALEPGPTQFGDLERVRAEVRVLRDTVSLLISYLSNTQAVNLDLFKELMDRGHLIKEVKP